jgi:hypothetical protein
MGSLSRRRIFALLAAFAALAALLSACGGGGSSQEPQQVIEEATFEGLESGDLGLTLNVKSEGQHGGEVKVDLSGPFQKTGKNALPELAMEATAKGEADGEKIDFEGGITLLNDRAYVGYKGKQYEVDPTTFSFMKAAIEKGEQQGEHESAGGEATACQKAATSLDLSEFVDNLESEGSEEVEGVKTTKLSGDLNPKGAVDAIIKLAETPACTSELEAAGPLPLGQLKAQEGQLTGAIKKAHVEIYVGESDHIPRKVATKFALEPKGSGEKVEVEFEFTLGKVNEKQTIKAPANAEPLEGLFSALGVNPNELLQLMQGGGSGAGLGSLLEGITGGSSSGGESSPGASLEGSVKELEGAVPKEFNECLHNVKSAADLQKCTKLME